MKKIAVLFGAAAVVASSAMVAPAQANTNVVEELVDDVRARVCQEEHGYGVIDCSQELDPTVEGINEKLRPVVEVAGDAFVTAVETAKWAAENGPVIIEDQVNYVYCWVADPEDPYCQGPLD